ncbi:MAG: tetratricopeptide repeat protein [Hyphomicrobiales bacterium]
MSDQFAREVDEDLRSEYLKRIWDRFGVFIIATAVIIIVATAGYRGWSYFNEQAAQTAGDSFMDALQLAEDGEDAEALKAFQSIAESSHDGYAALARFRIATELASEGNVEEAIAEFDKIAETTTSNELKAMANMRAGLLLVDSGTLEDVQSRLAVLSNPNSAWRHSAREYIALSAYKAGDLETATSTLDLILEDQESLQSVRSRAQILKTLVESAGSS